jgi:hypothetical protein
MARPVTSEFISRGAFVRLDCLGIGNKPPNVAVEDNAVAAENFTCASLRFQVLADTKRQAEPTGLVECNAKAMFKRFTRQFASDRTKRAAEVRLSLGIAAV